MVWSHNDNWMVFGEDGGAIKYWQNNMNNVKVNKSTHKESVRVLSFCRTDLKFCSCSDDTTLKVWDFAWCQEEHSLTVLLHSAYTKLYGGREGAAANRQEGSIATADNRVVNVICTVNEQRLIGEVKTQPPQSSSLNH